MNTNSYSLHILFEDGSNPYVRYGMTVREFADELKKWDEHYILEPMAANGGWLGITMHLSAKEKNKERNCII